MYIIVYFVVISLFWKNLYTLLVLQQDMKRKIVQHGSSSLTITLPVKWAVRYGLKKGDELNVEESGPGLTITTGRDVASAKKEVSTTDFGIFTKNNLSHLYQLGYDEIEIRFDNPETLKGITSRLSNCLGFEIIDQKKDKVYIKSIATTLESEFDTLLRKAFLITNEMARSILEVFERQEYQKLREIRNMESLNNKFTDVCIRILNKKGYSTQKRTLQIYEIVKNVERIADEFKHICDLFADHKGRIEKPMLESYREAIDYYATFYSMFYKFQPELKKKIYLDRKSLLSKYYSQLEKSKAIDSVFLHHIIQIVEKSYEAAGGYFALIL